MAEIRSAIEIALEKADRLGHANKEEMETLDWLDKGRRLAAAYLSEAEGEFRHSLDEIPGPAISHVLRGATEILLRNITLPRDKEQWPTIRRALKGVKEIKGSMASQVIPRIEQLLQNYEHTYSQYRQQLTAQMQGRLGGVKQALAQQYGMAAAAALNVELLPEFQQEWSRLSAEIKEQFEEQLKPLKAYLE